MPYCENCGKEINVTSKFCGRCGSQVNIGAQAAPVASSQPATVPPQPTPQASVPHPSTPKSVSEPVVCVLSLRKPKSLGRYDSFSGVLTGQRLIFAQMTGDMLKDAIKQAREQAKADCKGFFGQWGEQLKASATFAQRYYGMEPSAVLSETQGNFAVSNSSVSEIKLKLKTVGNRDNNQREFEVEFKSSSGKYKFRMDENHDYLQVLKQVYGDRVKTPFGYFSKGGFKFSIG